MESKKDNKVVLSPRRNLNNGILDKHFKAKNDWETMVNQKYMNVNK